MCRVIPITTLRSGGHFVPYRGRNHFLLKPAGERVQQGRSLQQTLGTSISYVPLTLKSPDIPTSYFLLSKNTIKKAFFTCYILENLSEALGGLRPQQISPLRRRVRLGSTLAEPNLPQGLEGEEGGNPKIFSPGSLNNFFAKNSQSWHTLELTMKLQRNKRAFPA